MKIIKPYYKIKDEIDGAQILKKIEEAGRICYKSEDNITSDSAQKFVEKIIKSSHESVIEHEKLTILFVCDRGVSHEIVRHRIASYSQESTRYCNYNHDRFDNELTFIAPLFWEESEPMYIKWSNIMQNIENTYKEMIENNVPPEYARSILPNSLKTEIVVTMNLREWRHFFKLRTNPKAHAQLRELSIPLLNDLKNRIPVIFDDISS